MFLDGIDLTKKYVDEHLEEIKDYLTCAKKAKNWAEVKRIQNLMKTVDPTNIRIFIDLIHIAKMEGDFETERILRLEKLQLFPCDGINAKGLYNLSWKLQDLGLLEIALTKLKELYPDKPKTIRAIKAVAHLKEQINNGSITEWNRSQEKDNIEFFSKTLPNDETGISELREQLYGGEISQEKFSELVDSYSDSTQGIIFLAEGCMYFKKPKTAQKALNGYRKTHQSIQLSELKAINQAVEIVKSKQRIVDPKKWERIYVALNKALQELDER